ncbi:hypothetical protein Taro_015244, partial [Colocasia esculenta]|nr:hypothetical protein [Colocasia esculenta]
GYFYKFIQASCVIILFPFVRVGEYAVSFPARGQCSPPTASHVTRSWSRSPLVSPPPSPVPTHLLSSATAPLPGEEGGGPEAAASSRVGGPQARELSLCSSPHDEDILLGEGLMAACSSLLGRVELPARNLDSLSSRNGQTWSCMIRVGVPARSRQIDCYRRVSGSLKNREPAGNDAALKCFWSDIGETGWRNPFLETGAKYLGVSSAVPCSANAASDVVAEGSVENERLDTSSVSSDQKVLGDKRLRLLSGSCYLPHPDKEATGGEDAHFICTDEQAIGVADGVGGWADMGVDSGKYARELMSNSVSAIQDEPKGSVDPARVLEKAYSSTKAMGSSTACIVALTDQGVNAVNLGDSGFILVRDGCTVFQSPSQQHSFNLPFQLESGNFSDLPSAGEVFTLSVAPGDVIVAGTDGLFDNLYNDEVTTVVADAIRDGLGPQVTAQRIAALARQRAQDRKRQTPFSTAAQDAGYWYNGGKLDDITVVVSYITASDR